MRKRVLVLVVLLCICLCVPTFAAEKRMEEVFPSLSFSNNEVECSVEIYSSTTTDRITAVIKLYEDGKWLITWHVPATGVLDFSQTVDAVKGSTYKLVVDATIAGAAQPTAYIEKTYR